ncbi:MAG: prepilin peptidase CpaA [Zhongshania aliphaticivorans]|jgi:prepilin peptidase CpaA
MLLIALLLIIGYIDWQQRRIPNSVVVILAGWAAYSAAFSSEISAQHIAINIGIALILTLPGYIRGIVGGGDVKLMLVIAPLWAPLQLLSIFSIGIFSLLLLMTFTHLFSQMKMSLTKAHYPHTTPTATTPFKRGVPLGSAIALGAVIVTMLNFSP